MKSNLRFKTDHEFKLKNKTKKTKQKKQVDIDARKLGLTKNIDVGILGDAR